MAPRGTLDLLSRPGRQQSRIGDAGTVAMSLVGGFGRMWHTWALRPIIGASSEESVGWVAEWSKAAVLKTAVPLRVPWVRIPAHPLFLLQSGFSFRDDVRVLTTRWPDRRTVGWRGN